MYTGLPSAKSDPVSPPKVGLVAYEGGDDVTEEKPLKSAELPAAPSFAVPPLPSKKRQAAPEEGFAVPGLPPAKRATPAPAPTFTPPSLPRKKSNHEYDPEAPNDYDDVIKERHVQARQREKEKEIHRRQQAVKRHDKEAGITSTVELSGDEAYTRRAIMSGKRLDDISVPDMEPDPEEEALAKMSPAERMMAKMGFNKGQGLGKNESGMIGHLEHIKIGSVTGVIREVAPVREQPKPKAPPPPKKSTKKLRGRPSEVVLLRNMVLPKDVDTELEADVREECQHKYGGVEECKIHVMKVSGIAPCEAVRIFVKFGSVENALKAAVALDGRGFGGRSVVASFYDSNRYKDAQYTPDPGEEPLPVECYE